MIHEEDKLNQVCDECESKNCETCHIVNRFLAIDNEVDFYHHETNPYEDDVTLWILEEHERCDT
jgi:hypothetical protein